MARFFLHHRLENLHQLGRKKAGRAGNVNQPECKERIETFAESGEQKLVFQRSRHMGRRCLNGDAVVLGERGQQPRMAILFEALQLNRLAQLRI